MSNYVLVLNDELYHHGIKGQKWGVRRFQNPDGTLTDRGKKKQKAREEDINERQKWIQSQTSHVTKREKAEAKLRKKILNGDKKTINEVYEDEYGYDSLQDIEDYMGVKFKSKKEAALNSLDNWKLDNKRDRERIERDKKEVDKIKNTPINKLTKDEADKIRHGVNKAAFMLNTLGSITAAALLKKYTNIETSDAVKLAIFGDAALSITTAIATDAIENKHLDNRYKKHGY